MSRALDGSTESTVQVTPGRIAEGDLITQMQRALEDLGDVPAPSQLILDSRSAQRLRHDMDDRLLSVGQRGPSLEGPAPPMSIMGIPVIVDHTMEPGTFALVSDEIRRQARPVRHRSTPLSDIFGRTRVGGDTIIPTDDGNGILSPQVQVESKAVAPVMRNPGIRPKLKRS